MRHQLVRCCSEATQLPDGGYGRKQQQVYDNVNDTNVYVNRSNEEVASPGLKLRLAGLMSGGQKPIRWWSVTYGDH